MKITNLGLIILSDTCVLCIVTSATCALYAGSARHDGRSMIGWTAFGLFGLLLTAVRCEIRLRKNEGRWNQ